MEANAGHQPNVSPVSPFGPHPLGQHCRASIVEPPLAPAPHTKQQQQQDVGTEGEGHAVKLSVAALGPSALARTLRLTVAPACDPSARTCTRRK